MAKKIVKKAKSKPAKKAAHPKTSAAKLKNVAEKPVKKKSVKGFNTKDLIYFKKIITEKRKEILEELAILKESMMDVTTGEYASENSTYSTHMEQGTDAMEREKTFLFASREGKFLNYLDDALKRIDKGTYGFCINCGKLIPKARLEAVPHAQLCIECKHLKKGSM
ncbi:MAG: TraR/DksA C4-type zinc finger protein [Bacteroidota bacterium]